MNKRVWVTGASGGLGLALVEQLLEQGALVTASGRPSVHLQDLASQYGSSLLLLDSDLTDPLQALRAARQIADRWGALDCLIINAGTCDYLEADIPASALFEGIVTSNLSASSHCLDAATALLHNGSSPKVLGILSRYSSLQLHEPSQPARPDNSLAHLFNSHRPTLAAQAIDLTIIAPLSLKFPAVPMPVVPEQWTAQNAADVILQHGSDRSPELVLEALNLNSLWPLPK